MITLAAIAVLTLAVSGVWAQGWGRGMGRGLRWANVPQEQLTKISDLHQKIRQAQWDLWTLQAAEKPEQKKIESKTKEVLRLREQLAKTMTELPAAPCFQAGQAGTTPPTVGMGWGRGPCALGYGPFAGGRGFGRGGGRWMGACPWWGLQQPTTPQTQPQSSN
jgi:hypothetical protein